MHFFYSPLLYGEGVFFYFDILMNTRQLEYILAIAEEKNILRASEKLFISQSTLSQTLINLEKELGTI